jgi:agmatinase
MSDPRPLIPKNPKKIPDNFGGLPSRVSGYRNSAITVLPVAFDITSSWMKGSAKGPRAIIEASKHMELYDIETSSEVYLNGIHTAKELRTRTSSKMINAVQINVNKYLTDNKFVVVLGGEHTVSLGSIKAHLAHFSNMSVLHLDAHTDMRNSYEGNKFSHACVMARTKEITDNIVSVGIRSIDSSELKNINKKNVFYAKNILKSRNWIQQVIRKLSRNVYITIDVDVFDPSIMPSTGTPEPGGLGWYDVVGLLETVSESRNITGFDVVELCPSENRAPDFLTAKLIYKILSLKFQNCKKK